MSKNALLFLLICLANWPAMAGETQRLTVRPGLVELRLPGAPAGADISWEAKEPITADFRSYESGSVLVTYLASGTAVFASDVIDWERRQRDRTTWIVTVEGSAPVTPVKPDPVTPVKPDPPGLAGEVFRMARQIKQPEIASRYANAFRTAIAEIGAGGLKSPSDARDRITSLCTGISPGSELWKAVGAFIAGRLRDAKTLPEISAIFGEAMAGLEAAGEKR